MTSFSSQNEIFESPDPEITFQAYTPIQKSTSLTYKDRDIAFPSAQYPPEQTTYLEQHNAQLEETQITPSQAFECFMGKQYPPNLQHYEAQQSSQSQNKRLESPLERFTRLKLEVNELESDLSLIAKDTNTNFGQRSETDQILSGIKVLQQNLHAMHANSFVSESQCVNPTAVVQTQITNQFLSQLQAYKASDASSSAPELVYEIYHTGDTDETHEKHRIEALEARITALERIIGSASDTVLLRQSLVSSVSKLEKRVALLDEKNLEMIKVRVHALLHSFSKLQDSNRSPQTNEKLQTMYEQLQSVQDTSAMVPVLINRLVALKQAHDGTLSIAQRLNQMEQANKAMEVSFTRDNSLLEKMQETLLSNVQIFQDNIQHLDERMKELQP